METYQATLFHPEGDFVTDFRGRKSIQDVWNEVSDMGSRWIFYPIAFVTNGKTVLDTPEGLEHFKGKRIKTLARFLNNEWKTRSEEICESLNDGVPLYFIY